MSDQCTPSMTVDGEGAGHGFHGNQYVKLGAAAMAASKAATVNPTVANMVAAHSAHIEAAKHATTPGFQSAHMGMAKQHLNESVMQEVIDTHAGSLGLRHDQVKIEKECPESKHSGIYDGAEARVAARVRGDGQITMYSDAFISRKDTLETLAHEAGHIHLDAAMAQFQKEVAPGGSGLGRMYDTMKAYFSPAYYKQLAAEDGCTDYSTAMWKKVGKTDPWAAIHETYAEIGGLVAANPGTPLSKLGVKPSWEKAYTGIQRRAAMIVRGTYNRYGKDSMTGDGEGAGHAFRGNQYIGGKGGAQSKHVDVNSAEFRAWFGDSMIVNERGEPLKLYRGGQPTGTFVELQPSTHEYGYQSVIFASSNPEQASSFAREPEYQPSRPSPFSWSKDPLPEVNNPGGSVVPFYVKSADVREFKFDHYRDGTKRFDKFRFDEEAKRLGPGQVLIARAVSDSGGHGHNRPTGVSTHGDQYAIGKGTSMKNALFNSGSFKGVSTTDSMTGDGEGAGHAFRGNQHVKGHGNGGVHTPDTKSAAFKSWFEGSKVVDDAGKPLVVYHGTEVAGITNFHIPKDGVAYFTPDVGYGYIQKTANVMPCYLSLKNPLYTQNSSWIEGVRSDPSWVADLKAKGHDGIIYAKQGGSLTGKGPSGWGDDRVQICVFEPHQIKSAIANTGRFGKHGVIYDGVEKDGVGEVGPAAATITLDGSMTKE